MAAQMRATGYPGTVRLVEQTLASDCGYHAVAVDLTHPAARKTVVAVALLERRSSVAPKPSERFDQRIK
jgi:hypothetical protein